MINSQAWSLEQKIGQMLIAGFRGYEVKETDPIARDIATKNLGGVIFFDQEMANTTLVGRNIQSPEQVKKLSTFLKSQATTPLFVSIDQEGGRVNRLKPTYGFPESISHEELGKINDAPTTFQHAETIAKTLRSAGINLNMAPVVDLDANPDNPIIKGKKRSFSSDPEIVAQHAIQFVKAHQQHNVLTCAKHFPGHGSAMGDTHLGLVDVTKTWSDKELIPFQRLIEANACEMIMSAHVFNANLDPNRPATLSKTVISGILRQRLSYNGVIISDDMEMKAISGHYGLENAVGDAINAGIDILCFGNNMSYDLEISSKAIAIVLKLVHEGKISESRIDESCERILNLKGKLKF